MYQDAIGQVRIAHVLVGLLPALGFGAGCSGSGGESALSSEPEAVVEEQSSAVWGGNETRMYGVAQIFTDVGSCSASILNNITILTAAHCFDEIRNKPQNIWVNYQAPDGDHWYEFTDATTGKPFVYIHPNFSYQNEGNPAESWDVAVIALNNAQSLMLAEEHFLGLYTGSVKDGTRATQVGYSGGPFQESGVQRHMQVEVNYATSNYAKWRARVTAGQMICSGDSGGPGLRSSGSVDANGVELWNSVAWVLSESVSGNGGAEGTGHCDDDARATRVNGKVEWINEIVEYWSQGFFTCAAATSANGESTAECWQLGEDVIYFGEDV